MVTDGARLLLGHATRSPRWDIPKGAAEPGETHRAAAARELGEETGLIVPADALIDLGLHRYLPAKDLALFAWTPPALPDPTCLLCRAMVERPGAVPFPELDRFGLFPWATALTMVGKNLSRVLEALAPPKK